MSETVYIETSILGYLTARSTKNLILAANMEITKDWWEFRRNAFILYTSEAVLDEVAQGDVEIGAQRLGILRDFPLLALNEAVQGLVANLVGWVEERNPTIPVFENRSVLFSRESRSNIHSRISS
jgi:hypothetical protein